MNIKRGTYRNKNGVEMTVTSTFVGPVTDPYLVLGGDISIAESRAELFGKTTWLVTAASLESAGYELIKEES